jgi:hypothetical protein
MSSEPALMVTDFLGNRGRFMLLHSRWGSCCHPSFLNQLVNKVGDEAGPARLMRRAASAAIVAVEVFMEEDVVLEIGILLELSIPSEDGAPAVGVTTKNVYEAATQLVSDFVERQHRP